MCGIFGFIGERPDPDLLLQAALLASERGPDGCGWAFTLGGGGLFVDKFPGPLAVHQSALVAGLLERCPRAVIGQGRLATSGDYTQMRDTQPLVATPARSRSPGYVALVHNGNVFNHQAIIDVLGWPRETHCDSEAILAALVCDSGPWAVRGESILSLVDRRSPLTALVLTPEGLMILQRDRLLWHLHTPNGHYFASRRFHPDAVQLTAPVTIYPYPPGGTTDARSRYTPTDLSAA